MSESSTPAPRRHNRANWVALRTLRQLPKVVGETSAGEPIVEVRSVRLVLREGAAHFSRMATCSKCGREVPGAAILSPSDLDHPPHPVICRHCVRTASAPVLRPERRPVKVVPEPRPEPQTESPSGAAPEDSRLAALDARLSELAELHWTQRAEPESTLEANLREM